jgi:hypothetical protein
MCGKEKADEYMPFSADWDTVYYLYFEAIDLCCDRKFTRYFEDYGDEVTGLESDDMTEYFDLAYKFGKLKGLSEDENHYLTDSLQNYHDTICEISHYSFGCKLNYNNRRKPRLLLVCYPDYYVNAEVIYQLYQFFGYYKEMLPLLQSELREVESKLAIKEVPLKKARKSTKRRKKAA